MTIISHVSYTTMPADAGPENLHVSLTDCAIKNATKLLPAKSTILPSFL